MAAEMLVGQNPECHVIPYCLPPPFFKRFEKICDPKHLTNELE